MNYILEQFKGTKISFEIEFLQIIITIKTGEKEGKDKEKFYFFILQKKL